MAVLAEPLHPDPDHTRRLAFVLPAYRSPSPFAGSRCTSNLRRHAHPSDIRPTTLRRCAPQYDGSGQPRRAHGANRPNSDTTVCRASRSPLAAVDCATDAVFQGDDGLGWRATHGPDGRGRIFTPEESLAQQHTRPAARARGRRHRSARGSLTSRSVHPAPAMRRHVSRSRTGRYCKTPVSRHRG